MRKSVIAAALAMLLVFAATALAKKFLYAGEGTGDDNVKVSFYLDGPDHKPSKGDVIRIEDFNFSGATAKITCPNGGSETVVGHRFKKPIRLQKDREFEDTVNVNDFTKARVVGQYQGRFTFTGSVRWFGDAEGCSMETGLVKWKAKEVDEAAP